MLDFEIEGIASYSKDKLAVNGGSSCAKRVAVPL